MASAASGSEPSNIKAYSSGLRFAEQRRRHRSQPDLTGAEQDGPARRGAVRTVQRFGFDLVRPITLLGVAVLGEPDLLVEVEATAVLS